MRFSRSESLGAPKFNRLLALLGIVQRQIKVKRTPEMGKTLVRKPIRRAEKTLGQWIRYWRLTKGITQRQLAQNTGLPLWRLQAIERDGISPTADDMTAIEEVLCVVIGDSEVEGRR